MDSVPCCFAATLAVGKIVSIILVNVELASIKRAVRSALTARYRSNDCWSCRIDRLHTSRSNARKAVCHMKITYAQHKRFAEISATTIPVVLVVLAMLLATGVISSMTCLAADVMLIVIFIVTTSVAENLCEYCGRRVKK